MLKKHFRIKQRDVNEAKPFCSYTTQNLYKLQSEKRFRAKLIDEIHSAKDQDHLASSLPQSSAPIKLLNDYDEDISEAEVINEKDVIKDHYKSSSSSLQTSEDSDDSGSSQKQEKNLIRIFRRDANVVHTENTKIMRNKITEGRLRQ